MLISIETHIILVFQGGGGRPGASGFAHDWERGLKTSTLQ